MTITIRGTDYEQTSRAWWMDRAYINPYISEVVVARVHVTRCHDKQNCMLDLTESDLAIVGTPGLMDFPDIIDGPRPKHNRTDKPLTNAQVERAYDALQNEGY